MRLDLTATLEMKTETHRDWMYVTDTGIIYLQEDTDRSKVDQSHQSE